MSPDMKMRPSTKIAPLFLMYLHQENTFLRILKLEPFLGIVKEFYNSQSYDFNFPKSPIKLRTLSHSIYT